GFLVDVGRVDLDALAKRLRTERVGEQHREAVRLFARGATGTPDADRSGAAATVEDARDDVGCEEFPGLRIAKEARDVDENRVEEQREFLRVRLEVVAIAQVFVDAGRLHALLHSPPQAGSLVRGEIEAAAAPQVLEQLFELLSVPLLARRHAASPRTSL